MLTQKLLDAILNMLDSFYIWTDGFSKICWCYPISARFYRVYREKDWKIDNINETE